MRLNVVKEILALYESNDDVKRVVLEYDRFTKTEQGKFLFDFFTYWQGLMATELLSKHHTNLSPGDKDAVQRAMYEINKALEFLRSPAKYVEAHKNRELKLKGK